MPYKSIYTSTEQPAKESSIVESTQYNICLGILVIEALAWAFQLMSLELKNSGLDNFRILGLIYSPYLICPALQVVFKKTIIAFLSKCIFVVLCLCLPLVLFVSFEFIGPRPKVEQVIFPHGRVVEIERESPLLSPHPNTNDASDFIYMSKIDSKQDLGLIYWRTKRKVILAEFEPMVRLLPNGRGQLCVSRYGKPLVYDLDAFLDNYWELRTD